MLENTISLNNETGVVIRPIRPTDAILIDEMHSRLSPESIYYRYLQPRCPTLAEIQRLCQLKDGEGAAFVAVVAGFQDMIIGLAHYLIDSQGPYLTAEPALLIEDRFQGRGLGQALFQRLNRQALAQQVRAFNLVMHPANRQMMRIVQRSGLPFEAKAGYGIQEVHLRLEPQLQSG